MMVAVVMGRGWNLLQTQYVTLTSEWNLEAIAEIRPDPEAAEPLLDQLMDTSQHSSPNKDQSDTCFSFCVKGGLKPPAHFFLRFSVPL